MAVRWYLRYGLSYRDVEELLAPAGMRMLRAGSSAGPNHAEGGPGRGGDRRGTGLSTRAG
jgi:hypothetical protein